MSEVRGQELDCRGVGYFCNLTSYLCNLREQLVDRLQFLAGLEADGFAGRNGNFGAGAWVASDSGLARTHVEHSETAQFNAIASGKRLLHALEDGFDGELRLGLGDPGAVNYFIDDVELNHGSPLSCED